MDGMYLSNDFRTLFLNFYYFYCCWCFPGVVIVSGFISFLLLLLFNFISHRDEIFVSLVFAVRVDINQMSKVSPQYPFLGT